PPPRRPPHPRPRPLSPSPPPFRPPPGPSRRRFVRSAEAAGTPPTRDEDIAFARLPALSRWIDSRALSSERLTRIYLERLERFQPDRKSTRLNSSHVSISYAVFCLK